MCVSLKGENYMNPLFANDAHIELKNNLSLVRAAIYAGVIIGTKKSRANKARKYGVLPIPSHTDLSLRRVTKSK